MFDKDYFLNVNQYCVLTKSQSITIPKVMRESLNLRVGDEVAISFEIKSNVIKIEKLNTEEQKVEYVDINSKQMIIKTGYCYNLQQKTNHNFRYKYTIFDYIQKCLMLRR